MLSAVKAMSNDRCISHYFPLIAYIAPLQMAEVGDITVFSTRAVEAKGGRYKRISRRCCHRKKAAVVWKAVLFRILPLDCVASSRSIVQLSELSLYRCTNYIRHPCLMTCMWPEYSVDHIA